MPSFYNLFKSVAFSMDAEAAHIRSIKLLSSFPLILSEVFGGSPISDSDRYKLNVGGLDWTFPIGLAAGLDKNAEAIDFFSALYFGAIEVGTITPRPQIGNPKPRLFRYVEKKSLRNQMGFNNSGADDIYKNILASKKKNTILGINLGKNKTTSQEESLIDYQKLYQKFAPIADYLVLNLSSPNTPGLRELQKSEALTELLQSLTQLRKESPIPLYLKISPDLSELDLPSVIDVVKEYKLNGIIGTNTTIMTELGPGGISGELLRERSRKIRNKSLEYLKETPEIELIGVGGVTDISDLIDFWKNGGKVMQLYTSFIFKGPHVLVEIKEDIEKLLILNQVKNLKEFVVNIDKMKLIE